MTGLDRALAGLLGTAVAAAAVAIGVGVHGLVTAPHCHVRGPLPDPVCTPGAVLPVTVQQICTPGYAGSARHVPESEKRRVFAAYGLGYPQPAGSYEADHLISLELGGSNDAANLWPEAAQPEPGFHEKDRLENELHVEVCAGRLDLVTAQHEIASDWLTAYQAMPASSPSSARR